MKVLCRHGHFAFYPRNAEDVSRFANYYNVLLQPYDDYYTFPLLVGAPRYSLQLLPWLGFPALKTFEGREPWDVMRQNGFVYHIGLGTIVPKASILTLADLPQTNHYYLSRATLIQPGSRTILGQQILTYDGEFVSDVFQLRIRSFSFE